MSTFDKINDLISANLNNHGHYLTDPYAAEAEKIAATVDLLVQFVPANRREGVRTEILQILEREADLQDARRPEA